MMDETDYNFLLKIIEHNQIYYEILTFSFSLNNTFIKFKLKYYLISGSIKYNFS